MDPSKQIIDRLASWLRPRHRRATFGILLLMALLTGLHFSNFHQEIERSDLLDGEPCRPSQLQEITRSLNIEGLTDYINVEGAIMVPNEFKQKYYLALEKHGIPGFGASKTDSLQSNFFLAPSERSRIAKLQKRRKVVDMIVRLPYVAEAWLECDTGSSGFLEPDEMSAVVMIQPSSDQILSWDNIRTIRETIAGAFAALASKDIVVTDLNEGRAHPESSGNTNVQAKSVRWRVDRQRFYMEKIKRLLHEYPGIEIDVHVEQGDKAPGSDKLTLRVPNAEHDLQTASFLASANRIPASDHLATVRPSSCSSEPGANGVAAISGFHGAVIAASHVEPVVRPEPAASLDQIDKALSEVADSPTEVVHVIIRVPSKLLSGMSCPTDIANVKVDSADSKFRLIKDDIIKRVNPILPSTTAQNEMPVSVILEGEDSGGAPSSQALTWVKEQAQRHWPLVAVGLLGFITVLFNIMRAPDLHGASQALPSSTAHGESDSEDLKSKLASLIDRDPETAARVIKSWLRDVA